MGDEFVGPEVPGYEIGKLLGKGGMGLVWSARRLSDGSLAAVKVMHVPVDDRAAILPRFAREFEVLSGLEDPGLPRVFGRGVLPASGDPWVAMELLEGSTLEALPGYGRLAAEELTRIARSLLTTLSLVHDRGVVHRDLKPANVFLPTDGRVILLDFGVAFVTERTRLTATGGVAGTVTTMAPEQLRGEVPEPRTDLWGLGATLTLAAAGRPPLAINDLVAMVVGRGRAAVPSLAVDRPDLPVELVTLVDSCCSFARDDRPESAAVALQLLSRGGAKGSRAAPRPRGPRPSGRSPQSHGFPPVAAAAVSEAMVPALRHRSRIILLITVLIMVMGIGLGWWRVARDAGRSRVAPDGLVLRLLAGPWPPATEESLTVLARELEEVRRVPPVWRDRPGGSEAAALALLAAESRRRRLAERSWAVGATLLERHGELVAALDDPTLLDACCADAEAMGDQEGLVTRLRALRERCSGRVADGVAAELARVLVRWYRSKRDSVSLGSESSGLDLDSCLVEAFELTNPLVGAVGPEELTSAVLGPWVDAIDFSNAPATKRAWLVQASLWRSAPPSPARDRLISTLFSRADEFLFASAGGPGGDSVTSDLEAALEQLGTALELVHDGPDAAVRRRFILLGRVRVLLALEREAPAREEFARVQEIPFSANVGPGRVDDEVVLAERLGHPELALQRLREYSRVADTLPRRIEALRKLAVRCAKTGRLDEAITAVDRGLSIIQEPAKRREFEDMRRLYRMGDMLILGGE